MTSIRKIFTLVFLCLLCTMQVKGQTNPISISIAVVPPYSTNFSDYISSPTQTIVTIVNTSTESQTVFLAGSVTNLTINKSVRIPANQAPSVPPLILQPGVRILTGNELQTLVNTATLEYTGFTQQEILNGNLPEGLYQICLQAIDYTTLEQRSAPEPSGCSNVFQISFLQPPLLIGPVCGNVVNFSNPQNVIFNWVPSIGAPTGAVLSYSLKVVKLNEGQNPIQAMQSTTVPVIIENTNNLFFLLSALGPTLESGKQYAWQVTVSDLANQAIFSNGGKSEICTFRIGLPLGSDLPVQAVIVYPVPGMKIPFRNVPIIARYSPYSPTHRTLNSSLNLSSEFGQIDQVSNTQQWPIGRESFIQQQINSNPSLEQLLHVLVGRDLRISPGSSTLPRAATATVTGNFQLSDEGGNGNESNFSSSFQTGMPVPVLSSPVRDSSLTNHLVELNFNPTNFPAAVPNQFGLIPSPEVLKSLIGDKSYLFVAQIQEQYKVEVSRSASFDSVIYTKYDKYEFKDTIKSNKTEADLRFKFRRSIRIEHFFPDTGRYFWRVSWLRDFNDSLSSPYATSDIGRFFIHDGIAGEQVNSACMGECDAPIINDKVAVTSAIVGDSVQIGKFKMSITQIRFNGPVAQGKGVIPVPFLNLNLKVAFNDLQINQLKQVFSGSAGAEYDNSSLIPILPGVGDFRVTMPNPDSLMEFIDSGHSVATLDPNMPIGLPIGLDKQIDGERVIIAIMATSFKPQKATLAAGINIPLYGLRDILSSDGLGITNLSFGAADICFHPLGLAGASMGTLYMAEDVEIKFATDQTLKLKGSRVDLNTGIASDSGCYVSWDCDGFRALSIKGAVQFDTTLLVLEDVAGNLNTDERVEARFGFTVRKTGNWMAELDFDKFQLPGLKNWGFHVDKATLDFSDLANPAEMQFPTTYQGDRSVLWNGFHLKQLTVLLPKEFNKREVSEAEADSSDVLNDPFAKRTRFKVQDLLIDHSGLSGKLKVNDLLTLEQGKLGGWGFAVDSLVLEIVSNSFTRGGFTGKLVTPIAPDTLLYSSILSQSLNTNSLRYDFRVIPKDTITVPMWAAKMNLLPTSSINISADTSGFKPIMNLNGSISISQKIGEIPVQFIGVHFQQLMVQTQEPYISCNTFSFASPQKKMGGFPVSVNSVSLTRQTDHGLFSWDDTEGGRIALNFRVNVNFTGESNTFGGSTELAILSRIDMGDLQRVEGEEDPHPNKFDFPMIIPTGIDLKAIDIRGDLGFVEIHGFIRFFAEDSIYGKGFAGGIDATFIKTIKVKVVAGFGEVNDFRYWYADASVKFTPGIPVYSGLELFGFGGGAFYKMNLASLPVSASDLESKTPDEAPQPGVTLTGVKLIPDVAAFFGFKATIMFGSTGGGQVYNADVTLAGVISESGGLSTMSLEGNAYFMTNPIDRTFQAVRASVLLQYDFPQSILTGLFSVMVNVPMTIVGRQAGKIAGSAYLYSGPYKWQILVGTPNDRVGFIVANMFDFSGYMMAGQQLPPPPDPPENIEKILGPGTIVRSPGNSNGTGMAFGASFNPPKFDERYLCFRAKLDAAIGFDVNLFDYGATTCDGGSSANRLGMNGWYAQGSMYAYFQGAIDIRADVFGETVNLEILEINAAALLQAGLPNPIWMKGTIGGNYNIMNGIISGSCNFKLELGEQCQPPLESPLAGIKMIGDVSPGISSTGNDCGVSPTVVFNVDIDSPFTLVKNNSDGTRTSETVRFAIQSFTLKKGSQNITASLIKSLDHTRAMLKPEFLDPFTTYTVSITVKAEKLVAGNWVQAKRVNGTNITEIVSYTFKTGDLPDHIKDEYVSYSIPLNRQRFFTVNQYTKGQVQLNNNVGDIFFNGSPYPNFQYEYVVRFISPSGVKTETPLSWSSGNKRITYTIPDGLVSNTIYKIQFIHKSTRIASNSTAGNGVAAAGQLANVGSMPQMGTSFASSGLSNVLIRNRFFTEEVDALASNEFLYYEYSFRTGMYGTLSEKVNSLSSAGTNYQNYSPYEVLELKLSGPEKLEKYEVEGFTYNDGLQPKVIKLLSFTDSYVSSWHTTHIVPTIYDLYSRLTSSNYTSIRFSRQIPDFLGVPPKNILAGNYAPPLSNSEVNPGMVNTSTTSSTAGNFGNLTQVTQPIGGNLTGGISINVPGIGNNNQASSLALETSWYARADYNRLGSMVSSVLSRYGNSMANVDIITRNMVNRYRTTAYKNMYRGTYQIKITSPNIPGSTPSGGIVNSTKSFVY